MAKPKEGPSYAEECLIHVYWSGLRDRKGLTEGDSHLIQRGKVSADLGLEGIPDPPFTSAEMQEITFAAKIQALKCLRARKRSVRKS
jgi:hypothetical protein